MTDNPPVVDDTGDGVQPGPAAAPLPIPELGGPLPAPPAAAVPAPTGPAPEVTDEDRQQYGRLLDRAMERGLLSPYEYETRLGDLAEAPTLDDLKRIVTELPMFTASSSPSKPARTSRFGRPPVPGASDGLPSMTGSAGSWPPGAVKSQRGRWTKLIIVLIVVIALFVALSIYAEHLVNTHNRPTASSAWTVPVASAGDPGGTTSLRL
jgi:hypothetical protein